MALPLEGIAHTKERKSRPGIPYDRLEEGYRTPTKMLGTKNKNPPGVGAPKEMVTCGQSHTRWPGSIWPQMELLGRGSAQN